MTSPNTVNDPPPSFPQVNVIELLCVKHSRITGVSVYPERAEVTRLFKFEVKTGQNQVVINGLPNTLDWDSLRVEGRGTATIHDVTISYARHRAEAYEHRASTPPPPTSPALYALTLKRLKTSQALERTKTAIGSLESYLATMHVQYVEMTQIGEMVKTYYTTAGELDDRVIELEAQLKEIDEEIDAEELRFSGSERDRKLGLRSTISVFADMEGEVEITLVYAVLDANWFPLYDIRVEMAAKEEPITLVYKAAIEQDTGEDWNDVPLTLQTVTPTFGATVPTLKPWNISEYRPSPQLQSVLSPTIVQPVPSVIPTAAIESATSRKESSLQRERRIRRSTQVSSNETVSATFNVPGLTSIRSDGIIHNIIIAELRLNATMSWVCVPKKDTRVHLNAKIKNASQYTLLRGSGSVYVDGSFISRSKIPSVSPDESFDCHLGVDPSIRVTYHPFIKKHTQNGRYIITNPTSIFEQHITVSNTKSTPVERVRIVDQIPVSEDSQIQVNLVNPALPKRVAGKDMSTMSKPVVVSQGVLAIWDGVDEPEQDVGMLGPNGKLNWLCEIPPQGKVNLTLEWDVSAPAQMRIEGL